MQKTKEKKRNNILIKTCYWVVEDSNPVIAEKWEGWWDLWNEIHYGTVDWDLDLDLDLGLGLGLFWG